jgi:hypothetical protein
LLGRKDIPVFPAPHEGSLKDTHLHTDLNNMTAPELAAEMDRLQSNQANRVRKRLERREALTRVHPDLVGGSQEQAKVLAELNADLVAAEEQDDERMNALVAVLMARLTAPLQ